MSLGLKGLRRNIHILPYSQPSNINIFCVNDTNKQCKGHKKLSVVFLKCHLLSSPSSFIKEQKIS